MFDADGLVERTVSAKLFRRAEIEGGIPHRFDRGLRFGEDALFNIAFLSSATGLVAVSPRLVYYYDRSSSTTVTSFNEGDIACLQRYFAATDQLLTPLMEQGNLHIEPQDIIDFKGREVEEMVRRAALYGSPVRHAAACVAHAMRVPELRHAWLGMRVPGVPFAMLRRVSIVLMDLGLPVVALRIYRTLLRLKAHLAVSQRGGRP